MNLAARLVILAIAATSFSSKAAATEPVSPVGDWIAPDHGLAIIFLPSGRAEGEIKGTERLVAFRGTWSFIPDGRWKGYVRYEGRIISWVEGDANLTPKDSEVDFLLGVEPSEITYIKGSPLVDSRGRKLWLAGEDGNDYPVFRPLLPDH